MKKINKIAELIALVTLGVMTLLTVANVATRYLLTFTITWSDEIVLSLFVWNTMLFSAFAFASNSHLGMDLLPNIAGTTTKKALAMLSLTCITFVGAFLLIFGIQFTMNTMARGTSSAALHIPRWIETLSMPVGGALICLFGIIYFVRYMKELQGQKIDDDLTSGGVIA